MTEIHKLSKASLLQEWKYSIVIKSYMDTH
ncbi:hypothetical protein PARA125_001253 [Parachlamydia sp. AcF125]|nr:hypothetical protein [Parachlamydia sp. AcF125]